MLTMNEVQSIFLETGAMLNGHFLLTSGRHSDRYFQCAMVLQHPGYTEYLCRELAGRFAGEKIAAVVGPAMGGIIVSYEVARALGVRSMFAERENGVMKLRRGFSIKPGEKVLVVEDVITTGGSVREVIEVVRELGGEVAGAGVLVDRSNGTLDLGVKTEALLVTEVLSYAPEECPLCKKGGAAVKPGSRNI
ncbi:orotate phosphoribosyltransferase [Pelotomaculum terephthalicicum JT]|uniref:orotate phosphoribosyltransferase n=1 Tax=Pelotomaculum TaxID=191373 RepID=UPI0009D33DE2|nr:MULTISPECIES: orotate phosphoribosyltransferase [Pelotomaculum]MCG9967618.1 orotate phosphoribosyltransferase [Pelotomaculum terephthalicicum JT]OPX88781.1 MAG: Orotate phosphoribosyltransferase [Pelotomaculum sp. PtaB.Bin117]OPY60252.1 MAG: Orotate phosphoribosyltransferase [Pelotomaculum sp. PtaU1.Bin065]